MKNKYYEEWPVIEEENQAKRRKDERKSKWL